MMVMMASASRNTQVDGGESLDDLKAILEVDSGIPIAEQVLTNGGKIVTGCVWVCEDMLPKRHFQSNSIITR